MDTVTYPDPDVRAELDHWTVQSLDVTEDAALASDLGVRAIPTALAVHPDGRILARKRGFAPPDDFTRWLQDQCAVAGLERAPVHDR